MHRDVKPSNFRVHEGKLYITDFGTKIEYLSENSLHFGQSRSGFIGTPYYASISTHENKNQSRKDDIESLAYALLALILHGEYNRLWFTLPETTPQIIREVLR